MGYTSKPNPALTETLTTQKPTKPKRNPNRQSGSSDEISRETKQCSYNTQTTWSSCSPTTKQRILQRHLDVATSSPDCQKKKTEIRPCFTKTGKGMTIVGYIGIIGFVHTLLQWHEQNLDNIRFIFSHRYCNFFWSIWALFQIQLTDCKIMLEPNYTTQIRIFLSLTELPKLCASFLNCCLRQLPKVTLWSNISAIQY